MKELSNLLNQYEEFCDPRSKLMNESQFQKMMGMIGQSFIGKRIYSVLLNPGYAEIELPEYVTYYDIIYHGT